MTEWKLEKSEEHFGKTETLEAASGLNERITELVDAARHYTGEEMVVHGGYGSLDADDDSRSVPMVVVQLGERKFPFETSEARVLVAALLAILPVVSDDEEFTALLKGIVLGVYKTSEQVEGAMSAPSRRLQ